MSTLVTDELITTLSQEFRTIKPINCEGFKIWFYNHNLPSGTFSLKLKKGLRIIKEWSFTSLNMQASFGGTQPYFHVYMPFISESFILDGEYELELSSMGYAFIEGMSFIGINKDWDGVFGSTYIEPIGFTEFPYSFRILERI